MSNKYGKFTDSRETPDTLFAPGARAIPEDLDALARNTLDNPIVQAVLESAEGFVMVLDEHRQVVAANAELLHALGMSSGDPLLGLRPGEAVGCSHVPEGPSGCGTSAACSLCGAVLAILAAQTGGLPVDGECWLNLHREGRLEACEFRVRATPLPLERSRLIVLVLVDVSARKRQDVLESLFQHDIANTLQSLSGWAEVIQDRNTDPREAGRKILEISLRIKRQVSFHRLLMKAEKGSFVAQFQWLPVRDILTRIEELFAPHRLARERKLTIRLPGQEASVRSDPDLLLRVLENMVTNALEATPPGGQVEVWYVPGQPTFHVRNPGELPEDVALRIFQRSFSTKGSRGHGLGTYSMKLFTETYLGGHISFTSNAEEGITFTLSLV